MSVFWLGHSHLLPHNSFLPTRVQKNTPFILLGVFSFYFIFAPFALFHR